MFDNDSMRGFYEIWTIYMEQRDRNMDIVFEVVTKGKGTNITLETTQLETTQQKTPSSSKIQQFDEGKALTDSEISKLESRISSARSSIADLQRGLDESYNEITAAINQYESQTAKEHLEKALAVYSKLNNKLNEQKSSLNELENNLGSIKKNNTTQLGNENSFNIFSGTLNSIDFQLVKIGSEMKFISQEFDYAKQIEDEYKEKTQTCFLFWCS